MLLLQVGENLVGMGGDLRHRYLVAGHPEQRFHLPGREILLGRNRGINQRKTGGEGIQMVKRIVMNNLLIRPLAVELAQYQK